MAHQRTKQPLSNILHHFTGFQVLFLGAGEEEDIKTAFCNLHQHFYPPPPPPPPPRSTATTCFSYLPTHGSVSHKYKDTPTVQQPPAFASFCALNYTRIRFIPLCGVPTASASWPGSSHPPQDGSVSISICFSCPSSISLGQAHNGNRNDATRLENIRENGSRFPNQ